jgi:hypothetical protein
VSDQPPYTHCRRYDDGAPHQHRRRYDRAVGAVRHRVPKKFLAGLGVLALSSAAFVLSYIFIAESANAGCERDAATVNVLRGILERALSTNETLYREGVRTEFEYRKAKASSETGLAQLVVPEC